VFVAGPQRSRGKKKDAGYLPEFEGKSKKKNKRSEIRTERRRKIKAYVKRSMKKRKSELCLQGLRKARTCCGQGEFLSTDAPSSDGEPGSDFKTLERWAEQESERGRGVSKP